MHRSSIMTGLMLVGCWCFAPAVSAQTQPAELIVPAVPRPETLDPQRAALLGLRSGTVVTFPLDTTPGRAVSVEIPLGGANRTLALSRYSVRSALFNVRTQVEGGVIVPAAAEDVRTVRGNLVEVPGSVAAGGVMPEGLYAGIFLPDGAEWWIEPVRARIPGMDASAHVVYRSDDVLELPGFCGYQGPGGGVKLLPPAPAPAPPADGDATPPPPPGGDPPRPRGTEQRRVALMAFDTDVEFFNLLGSIILVHQHIEMVTNTMNVQYEREVDIRHEVGTIITRVAEPDPYVVATTGGMVDEMREHWLEDQGGIARDIACVFSGKNTGGVIGTAFGNGVCSAQWHFAAIAGRNPPGNNSYAALVCISAHELGHSWGHDDPAHCNCPQHTMHSFVTGRSHFHPTTSIPQIEEYAAAANCLATEMVDDGPPNDLCADSQPIGVGIWYLSNVGAATNGPTTGACAGGFRDVWFTYTATGGGTMTVRTQDSNFDPVLLVYPGPSCPQTNANLLGCDNDTNGLEALLTIPVSYGEEYLIRVGGLSGSEGAGNLVLEENFSSPDNDHCDDATEIFADGAYFFDTTGADTDGFNEPDACLFSLYSQVASDIWYHYVSPCDGTLDVNLCFTNAFDSKIALYHACPDGPDDAFACSDDSCGQQPRLFLLVDEGQEIWIRIGGFEGQQGPGQMIIQNNGCPPPPNDTCAGVIDVSSGVAYLGTLVNAGDSGASFCGAAIDTGDAWYRFTAPACAGRLRVTTCGTHDTGGIDQGMNSVLSLHTACPGNTANEITCNDNAFPSDNCGAMDQGVLRDAVVTLDMTADQVVYIRVSYAATSSGGPFRLNPTYEVHGDECDAPIAVAEGQTPVCILGADNDNPPSNCTNSFHHVWYEYTPTCDGLATVEVCGRDLTFDSVVGVYAGTACPVTLSRLIACNDDACLQGSIVTFQAQLGRPHLIVVGSSTLLGGTGTMTITCTPDDCPADFNNSGALDSQDFFDFLAAFFAMLPSADFNNDSFITSQDFFDFLAAFFTGCP